MFDPTLILKDHEKFQLILLLVFASAVAAFIVAICIKSTFIGKQKL